MQPIDRDRLRATLQAAAQGLSTMADRAIASKIPQLLPASLRPLLPLMVGHLQTRSLISDAATRATNELSDDELCALWQLIENQARPIFGLDNATLAVSTAGEDEIAAAVAHLHAILSE